MQDNSVRHAEAHGRVRQPASARTARQLLGLVVVLVGVGLLIGNVTGLAATFPFAGFIVMTIGGAIMGAKSAR